MLFMLVFSSTYPPFSRRSRFVLSPFAPRHTTGIEIDTRDVVAHSSLANEVVLRGRSN